MHIPWPRNRQADALSKLANSSEDGNLKQIGWETLSQRSIEPREILWLDRSSTWMDPIMTYRIQLWYT